MKALVQRVSEARVEVGGAVVGAIGPGLLVFVGVMRGDSDADAAKLSRKAAELRIFEDGQGKMNVSLVERAGEALVVSQFTLCAATDKGRRPGFDQAAPPDEGRRLVGKFVEGLQELGVRTAEGRFGESMRVILVNDGPATFWLDSR